MCIESYKNETEFFYCLSEIFKIIATVLVSGKISGALAKKT
jgi:hypothetical protein